MNEDYLEVSKTTQWVFGILIAIALLPLFVAGAVFTVITIMFFVKLAWDYWFIVLPLGIAVYIIKRFWR